MAAKSALSTTHFSRRRLFGVAAGGAAVWAINAAGPKNFFAFAATTQSTPGGLPLFADALPILATRSAAFASLVAAPAPAISTFRFHSSLPVAKNTWGYGGSSYLGPTLESSFGLAANVTMTNKLGIHPFASSTQSTSICMIGNAVDDANRPRISLHLHGAVTNPEFDGHPEDTLLPNQSKTYFYGSLGEAKMLWYHDHALGITRLNVAAGLAGAFIVRDIYDTGLAFNGLGLPTGKYEIPLVLQDKIIDKATGNQVYPPSPRVLEFFGDQPVVNGAIAPKLAVDRGVYRFRLVNASNARFFRLSLTPETGAAMPPMVVIGSDQGLLDAPVPVSALVIAPGERYDLLVDFSNSPAGSTFRLSNDAATPFPNGGSPTTALGTSTTMPDIMRFVVGSATGQRTRPSTLRGGFFRPAKLPAPPTTGIARTVTLLEVPDPNQPGGDPLVTLNNLLWNTAAPDAVQLGTTEIWSIVNATVDAHPIHLHLSSFRILDRQQLDSARYLAQSPIPALGTRWNPSATAFVSGPKSPPAAEEAGWKDTVVAYPGTVTRIAVVAPPRWQLPFDPQRTFKNQAGKTLKGYAWHCHLLEHEDCEMMVPLLFTDSPAVGL